MVEMKQGNGVAQKFKPKAGSVFPARRKLVKRMMFDQMLSSILSLLPHKSNEQNKNEKKNKKNKVVPE